MTDTKQPTERDLLKERASDLGLDFAANIPTDKLRELVNGALAPKQPDVVESKQSKFKAYRDEAMKLVRVRVTCLNQSKNEAEAEFFRVSNDICGVNRLVPFEVETHVEQILLNHIKGRQYAVVKHDKGDDGRPKPYRTMRNEFQVEILPALTAEELKDLAIDQSKRQSV